MSKAYLAWPVKLKGIKSDGLHITLKYLGDSPFTVEDLFKRLQGQNTTFTAKDVHMWTQIKFNPTTHVLALSLSRIAPVLCFNVVDDLRDNEYKGWHPHITIPKPMWTKIKKLGFTPQELIESIGPLTLYVDKIATFEWKP